MELGNDVQLICQVRPDRPWRICIPTSIVDDIIHWYHLVLGHAGIICLYQIIATYFVHPFLKVQIQQSVKSCGRCLQAKLTGAGYGNLPPCEATLVPWYEVTVST
jgi:hypothetical protein